MTLKNNRAPLLCYFKLCASFRSHWWIQTGVTVRKRPIWVKFDVFLELCDLAIWRITLKNNRAPLPCYFKLCSSFRSHWWIQSYSPETPDLGQIRRFFTSVTFTFDLWPWTFAWTSLLPFVITPENFVMIRWWEHSQKGVTDGQTDRRTDWTIHRAAWSQLKMQARWFTCGCILCGVFWKHDRQYIDYMIKYGLLLLPSLHPFSRYLDMYLYMWIYSRTECIKHKFLSIVNYCCDQETCSLRHVK